MLQFSACSHFAHVYQSYPKNIIAILTNDCLGMHFPLSEDPKAPQDHVAAANVEWTPPHASSKLSILHKPSQASSKPWLVDTAIENGIPSDWNFVSDWFLSLDLIKWSYCIVQRSNQGISINQNAAHDNIMVQTRFNDQPMQLWDAPSLSRSMQASFIVKGSLVNSVAKQSRAPAVHEYFIRSPNK